MNAGQEMFAKFFKGLVKEGKEKEAEEILTECFKLQDEGKFGAAAMATIMPRMFGIVKPECMDQLKDAASKFKPGKD